MSAAANADARKEIRYRLGSRRQSTGRDKDDNGNLLDRASMSVDRPVVTTQQLPASILKKDSSHSSGDVDATRAERTEKRRSVSFLVKASGGGLVTADAATSSSSSASSSSSGTKRPSLDAKPSPANINIISMRRKAEAQRTSSTSSSATSPVFLALPPTVKVAANVYPVAIHGEGARRITSLGQLRSTEPGRFSASPKMLELLEKESYCIALVISSSEPAACEVVSKLRSGRPQTSDGSSSSLFSRCLDPILGRSKKRRALTFIESLSLEDEDFPQLQPAEKTKNNGAASVGFFGRKKTTSRRPPPPTKMSQLKEVKGRGSGRSFWEGTFEQCAANGSASARTTSHEDLDDGGENDDQFEDVPLSEQHAASVKLQTVLRGNQARAAVRITRDQREKEKEAGAPPPPPLPPRPAIADGGDSQTSEEDTDAKDAKDAKDPKKSGKTRATAADDNDADDMAFESFLAETRKEKELEMRAKAEAGGRPSPSFAAVTKVLTVQWGKMSPEAKEPFFPNKEDGGTPNTGEEKKNEPDEKGGSGVLAASAEEAKTSESATTAEDGQGEEAKDDEGEKAKDDDEEEEDQQNEGNNAEATEAEKMEALIAAQEARYAEEQKKRDEEAAAAKEAELAALALEKEKAAAEEVRQLLEAEKEMARVKSYTCVRRDGASFCVSKDQSDRAEGMQTIKYHAKVTPEGSTDENGWFSVNVMGDVFFLQAISSDGEVFFEDSKKIAISKRKSTTSIATAQRPSIASKGGSASSSSSGGSSSSSGSNSSSSAVRRSSGGSASTPRNARVRERTSAPTTTPRRSASAPRQSTRSASQERRVSSSSSSAGGGGGGGGIRRGASVSGSQPAPRGASLGRDGKPNMPLRAFAEQRQQGRAAAAASPSRSSSMSRASPPTPSRRKRASSLQRGEQRNRGGV
jgi:hypothetical protein